MGDFQPGDVVVCVRAEPGRRFGVPTGLELSRAYTVDRLLNVSGEPTVYLVGVAHPYEGKACRTSDGRTVRLCGWSTNRFRRVYRPDGSFISKLLEPADLSEGVR